MFSSLTIEEHSRSTFLPLLSQRVGIFPSPDALDCLHVGTKICSQAWSREHTWVFLPQESSIG
jgi:hypothetical protein